MTYLSSTSVVLILRASETCFAPSAPRLLPQRLQTRGKWERQWLLTISCRLLGGREAAYSIEVIDLLTMSISATLAAPSIPKLLERRLRILWKDSQSQIRC